MISRLRSAAVPAYLFFCLLLGGSSQGIWANMLLQLTGLGLICWTVVTRSIEPAPKRQSRLLVLVLLSLLLILAQLIPLPAGLWRSLGPRHLLADDFQLLGVAPTRLPLSVAPYDSLTSLLTLIPPLAVLAAAFRLGVRPLAAVIALVAGTFAGILLGALQVSSADPTASPWYFFTETNFGVATGFFANANHMALLLVITLPFLAAILATAANGGRNVQRYSGALVLVAGAALVIAVGIALNGSLAGYGLAVPVVLASIAIAFPGRRSLQWLAPFAAILVIGAAGWLSTMPAGSGSTIRSSAATSVQSRQDILRTSLKAAKDFMPFGSGVGSFRRVYALYEDHDRLDPTTYVNHAHDDYVELAIETGVPGLILLALFLLWWGGAALRTWLRASPDPYAQAAAVASAAVLVHSAVDFPLRTAAISACLALCLALLVRRRPAPAEPAQLRPTRHVVVG